MIKQESRMAYGTSDEALLTVLVMFGKINIATRLRQV